MNAATITEETRGIDGAVVRRSVSDGFAVRVRHRGAEDAAQALTGFDLRHSGTTEGHITTRFGRDQIIYRRGDAVRPQPVPPSQRSKSGPSHWFGKLGHDITIDVTAIRNWN